MTNLFNCESAINVLLGVKNLVGKGGVLTERIQALSKLALHIELEQQPANEEHPNRKKWL